MKVKKAEIFWLAKVASNNFSLRSTDNLGDLFKAMFPDSKIAANFHLSYTSSSYMISEGLSPYFTRMIVNDLLKSSLPFSLHFDETTTAQVKKANGSDIKILVTQHIMKCGSHACITILWSC